MEHEIAVTIFLITGFFTVAVFSSVLLKKIRFPYTIGLVIIGILFGVIAKELHYSILDHWNLTPEIILYLMLPTLIYDAAINMDLKALRRNIVPILLMAVFGLLISAGIIGGLLSTLTTMGIGAALLFGALISATDPVAVIALFSEIGAPRRLVTLVDGESIFNDATAIVLFTIVLSTVTGGVHTVGELFLSSFLRFLLVLPGGLLIGSIIGTIGGLIVRHQKNNATLQIIISLIMAYVSFITADLLHVSGVISTLAAGIMVSLLSSNGLKHENRYFMNHFWDFFSFVVNSFVFLMLGLTEAYSFSNPKTLYQSLQLLLIVIPAVTVARAAGIYLLLPLYNRFAKSKKSRIPFSFQTVLFWGGLRGAVPVALVPAIPPQFPGKDIIVHITLGYILFTLIFQGTTVKALMDRLKIKQEKSYFDYHKGISYRVEFPGKNLLELASEQIITAFKNEGFFVSKPEAAGSYLINRGQKYLALAAADNSLTVTAETREDLDYGKQTVYETLLELVNSVSSLDELVKSPELHKFVQKENEEKNFRSSLNLSKYLKLNLIQVALKSSTKKRSHHRTHLDRRSKQCDS